MLSRHPNQQQKYLRQPQDAGQETVLEYNQQGEHHTSDRPDPNEDNKLTPPPHSLRKLESKRTLSTFLARSNPLLPRSPLSYTTRLPPLQSSIHPTPNSETLLSPGLPIILPADPSILPLKPSLHPALQSQQIRSAPRNTFNPSHKVRKRRHGFLTRLRSRNGRKILARRKAKRRSTLSH